MIGHGWTSFKSVNVSQHEVSDILDLFLTKITPEKGAVYNVPLKLHLIAIQPHVK